MQLTKVEKNFDLRKIEQLLKTENEFITDLFSVLCLPTRNDDSENELEETDLSSQFKPGKKGETTRAKSLSELQQRLHAITSKKKLSYKEKLAKKGLKNRLKKKNKQDERNAQQKLLRAEKITKENTDASENLVNKVEVESTRPKPVFNKEGKMVFSKIDFSNLGQNKKNDKKKKVEKDPKKLLDNLEKQKAKLNELAETGEVGKVVEIKEKAAWKNALAKSEGVKVKDDPVLLKKSIQKLEQKKRSSKKKWEKRIENVDRMKKDRQMKRNANIEKRKQEKQKKKIKKAVKKGKIIPGY